MARQSLQRQKSRHCRDESDPLLGMYSQSMTNTPNTSSSKAPAGQKSRHSRDESDALLRMYSQSMSNNNDDNNNAPNTSTASSSGNPPWNGGHYGAAPSLHPPKTSSSSHSLAPSGDKDGGPSSSSASSSPDKKKKRRSGGGGYRVHRVSYTAQNHVHILFRSYASAFPQVTPFAVANVLWALCVYFLKEAGDLDLTFHSSVGHSFMGLLVSFLIVNRSKISYDRFMEYRRHLATLYKTCREMAQFTAVYTYETQTPEAAWWRQEVCYRIILLLRVTTDALLWSSTEREKWEDEYFKFNPDLDGGDNNGGTGEGGSAAAIKVSQHFYRAKQLSHGRRSYIDENFRAPVNFAHVLRQRMMEHQHYLGYKMPTNEYRDLVNICGTFMDAFHGFRVLIFTPYPFPLLQMTRAFLFVWVYTLPMVLLKDYRLWSSCLIIILITFGFVGIEYISMNLDDPFGDDTNDVDEHGMALVVYEDIYQVLYRTDGPEAAMGLRDRVLERYRQGRELDCYREDMKGFDFWEPPEWWFGWDGDGSKAV